MKIYKEISLKDFEFWSGACDFREKLTDEEMDTLEFYFEEDDNHQYSETEINDIFWFDQESIAEWLDTTEEEIWARE